MIKSKKMNSVVAVVSACSLMAGFTSEAAPSQPDGKMMLSSVENHILEIQEDALQVVPDRLKVSTREKIEEEQKRTSEEIRQREQEAREREEREAEALRAQYQELMASIIFCEAGNQPYEGQVAVGAVIMNRVRSSVYPNSIEAVIYQSGQFGPASTGWLDRVRSSRGYTPTAMQAAADALAGANPIGGCLYFDQGGRGMKIGAHYFH